MKLNKTELAVFCELLDRFADALGNAGCNDFNLPDTEEGRKLAVEVDDLTNDGDGRPQPQLCCMDWAVLAVLRKKAGLIQ